MSQALMTLCCACMAAALCEQMLDGSRFLPAVRLVLGMELAAMAVSAVSAIWKILNG